MRRIFIVSFALLCAALAKGDGPPMGPPIPETPPPPRYTAFFRARVETEGTREIVETITTPSESPDGPLAVLEMVRQVWLKKPDQKGKVFVELEMTGPQGGYSCDGSGSSLHAAIEDAVRRAKEDLTQNP